MEKIPAVDIWPVLVEVRLDKTEEEPELLLDNQLCIRIPSVVLIFAKSKVFSTALHSLNEK